MRLTVAETERLSWRQIAIGAVAALGLIAESLHEIAVAIRDPEETK